MVLISALIRYNINCRREYAYCANTPVMFTDSTGYFAISIAVIGLIAGIIIGGTAGGIIAYNVAKSNGAEGWELVGWTAVGIVGGATVGAAIGYTGAMLFTKATGIIGFSITKYSVVPIKGITVLGSYPIYKEAAIMTNSGYYDIGNTWEKLNQLQRTVNNSQYLSDANKFGSHFIIYTDKVTKIAMALWEEIQYLLENGIPFEVF